jgi:hypothetical protein
MQLSRILNAATPLMIVCGLLASGVSAVAEQEGRHFACSDRTLSGDYGYAAEGVLIGTPGLPAIAPFRSVGMTHFDGRGNLSWLERTVINGVPANSDWTTASGTYSVNPNCTGTAVVITPNSPVPLHLDFVVVSQGREVHTVLESDAISSVFKKVE